LIVRDSHQIAPTGYVSMARHKRKELRGPKSALKQALRTAAVATAAVVSLSVAQFNESQEDALRARVNRIADQVGVRRRKLVHSFYSTAPLIWGGRLIPNWYLISGQPVELSRHTERGKSITQIACERAQVWGWE
jgi:hypothetical protein